MRPLWVPSGPSLSYQSNGHFRSEAEVKNAANQVSGGPESAMSGHCCRLAERNCVNYQEVQPIFYYASEITTTKQNPPKGVDGKPRMLVSSVRVKGVRIVKSLLTTVLVFALRIVFLVLPITAGADITISGLVEPASVTSGAVSESVFIADVGLPGSLTIDDGSTLIVDNVNGFAGIASLVDVGVLTISGATVELEARTALWITGGALAFINGGSQVLLNGGDDRRPGLDRGRGLIVGSVPGTSIVSIDGIGTHVDVVRRITLGGFSGGGVGQLALSNGATLDQISTDSSLFTSFIVGSNGSTGELVLSSGSTLQSLVPRMLIGSSGFIPGTGFVDLTGSSLLEVTTVVFAGISGGQATMTVTDSTLRVLADPAAPVPDGGSVFIATGDPSSIGNLTFDNAVGELEDHLYISHDGTNNTGQGAGQVSVCDSTLTVPDVVIGEGGAMAGTTINGDVTVEGGSVAPGCSPGEMDLNGDATFVDGELVIEVAGLDSFDVLNVLGTADFQAGSGVRFLFDCFVPKAGDSFRFLNAGPLMVPADQADLQFAFEGLQEGFEFEVSFDATGFDFEATADGVPDFCAPAIDIKPGSDPNSINPSSNQRISVGVFSTDTFDATQVDVTTVAFGPNGATEAHGRNHIEDINNDGIADLVLHFETQATGIQCGDTEATLTAQTVGGAAIAGSDAINTVNCH